MLKRGLPIQMELTAYRLSGGSFMSDTDSESAEDSMNGGKLTDWDLPIVFNDKRHLERILGTGKPPYIWRMKERVK